MASKKNLFRNGKIATLLDCMQDQAVDELEKIEADLEHALGDCECEGFHNDDDEYDEDYLLRQKKIYDDMYELVFSLRKYVPLIEAGAMTLAEAITCESRRSRDKDE